MGQFDLSILIKFIIPFLVTFLISFILTRIIIKHAAKFGWVDQPDHRKVHKKTIATMGGLAISFAFLISLLIFCNITVPILALFFSVAILCLIGAVDDKYELSAKLRLFVQIVLASALIYFFNWDCIFNGITELSFLPSYLLKLTSVLLIVGFINAFNFIDGIDGLSGSYALISSLILAVSFYIIGEIQFTIIFSILAGAVYAFNHFNFPPAKIFMGDSGSTVLGLLLATGAIELYNLINNNTFIYPSNEMAMIPFLIFVIPIFDLIRTLFFRKLNGESFLNPDKTHLHHLLIKSGLNHLKATSLIVILYLSLLFFVLLFATFFTNLQMLVILIAISVISTEGITIFHFLINLKKHRFYKKKFNKKVKANQFLKRNL